MLPRLRSRLGVGYQLWVPNRRLLQAWLRLSGPSRHEESAQRAVIVIDEHVIVRHPHDHMLWGLGYQSVDELKAALDALPAPTAS